MMDVHTCSICGWAYTGHGNSGNGHQNPIYVGALGGGGNVSRGREAAKQPALTITVSGGSP